MKLFIKNMVCGRCKMVVRDELKKLGLNYTNLELGEVEIAETISSQQRDHLNLALMRSGLELMDDRKSMLIEKIKNVVIEHVHISEEQLKTNFSIFLSEKLGYDYTYLANIFSEVQGITIEKFLIAHKIERVKELLVYDELNLTEIAHRLHYSSVSHLSNQFKKITGLTPTHFKQTKDKRRMNLENVGMMQGVPSIV
jgi:AraC-like DNA-binding protein